MERWARMLAGTFIHASLVLAPYADRSWIGLTPVVGAHLPPSAFTRFRPLELLLRKLGVGRAAAH